MAHQKAAMAKTSFFKSKIFPILLVNFIGILGYSVVIPILIFLVTDMGGNGFIYGILGAMYPLFQFIGAPILGKMSDRIGRKKVLIISQLGTFLAWCLFILSFFLPETELWSQSGTYTGEYVMTLPLITIFLARIFDGFTGGNISVANAYLSDISTEEDRNKNFGQMGAATSFGFVIGPAFAGVLAATAMGSLLPIIVAAVISLAAIFVIQTRLKEEVPGEVNTGKRKWSIRRFFQVEQKDCFNQEEDKPNNSKLRAILAVPEIPLLYFIYFLTFLAFSLFYAGLPIYANTILNWNAAELGVFLAYSSLIMVIAQGPLLSWLSARVTSKSLIASGALLLGLGFLILTSQNLIVLYGGCTVFAIGNGLMWPSFMGYLAGLGDKKIQGAIQGFGTSMGSFASIIGLVVGGILFEYLTTTVFVIGAVVFFIITVITLLRFKTEN